MRTPAPMSDASGKGHSQAQQRLNDDQGKNQNRGVEKESLRKHGDQGVLPGV